MTRYSKNKKSCAQRKTKWIEARLAEYQKNVEASEPSEGRPSLSTRSQVKNTTDKISPKSSCSGLRLSRRWIGRYILIRENRTRAVYGVMSIADRPWFLRPFWFGRKF
ncbi:MULTISPECIES: hypothetical protein [unclassified Prochlorococcus]|uniref:hypothetical protein n=1 Tax=unclassified Prochlorococcus TaxID=2627481 RepID=UPI00055E13F2|nr:MULTISPECIES: hypothetical protein [unclassified Prochlorococcus]